MSEESRTQLSRRSFVLSTLTATGALAATGAGPSGWRRPVKRPLCPPAL